MDTWHFNGEEWYERNWSLFHRIRHWFIWIGGWEKANGEGWHILRRDNFHAAIKYKKYKRLFSYTWMFHFPAPVTFFGHRFTWMGWDWGWQLRTKRGHLVYSKKGHPKPIMYLSPDGTPSSATDFYLNPPHEIIKQIKQSREDRLIRDVEHKLWLSQQKADHHV